MEDDVVTRGDRSVFWQRGFTLIELMIVVTVIGILAAISIPMYQKYMIDARLNEAKPYLMDIAARQLTYKVRNGLYCCTGDSFSEPVLTTGLGVDLDKTGNFCFMVVCRDAALCAGPKTTAFIAASETGDPTVEFEVWGVLRASSTTTLTGPQSTTCTMSASKYTPTGWVKAAASGLAGREGRVMVFRYPPPPNGKDAVTGQDGTSFSWTEGISNSHALN